jgi:hypothetical protein
MTAHEKICKLEEDMRNTLFNQLDQLDKWEIRLQLLQWTRNRIQFCVLLAGQLEEDLKNEK